MRIALNYLKLREDSNRLEVLHWGHFSFVFLAMTLELFYGREFFGWFFTTIFLVIFYRFFHLTKKELFYSFWTFSAILSLFLVNKILFTSFEIGEIRFLYFVGAVLLSIEMYILSSPIYYPRESWWEYDFRYRSDLKVTVDYNNKSTGARVTDLRRNAGCVCSFEEFNVGETLKLRSSDLFDDVLSCEIISKRIYSLGRPYNYGVKFELDTPLKKRAYSDLMNIWKNERVQRRQKKFTTKSISE